jgi:hypothetical protein
MYVKLCTRVESYLLKGDDLGGLCENTTSLTFCGGRRQNRTHAIVKNAVKKEPARAFIKFMFSSGKRVTPPIGMPPGFGGSATQRTYVSKVARVREGRAKQHAPAIASIMIGSAPTQFAISCLFMVIHVFFSGKLRCTAS